jgi:hypothetical protein
MIENEMLIYQEFNVFYCASENATDIAIEALAVIYDIIPLYPGLTSISLPAEDFHGVAPSVLWDSEYSNNVGRLFSLAGQNPSQAGSVASDND